MNGESLVIDLCCGMGGLSLAAQNIGMKPIIGVDTDSSAIKTYKNNFQNSLSIQGDITDKATIVSIQSHIKKVKKENDKIIIVSGPPCQGFSIAGPRDVTDPRNQVLLAVANAISSIKPDMALIENVSFVANSKNKVWVSSLKRAISSAGYYIYHVELNAKDYGLAQNRRRIFFFITKNKLNKKIINRYLIGEKGSEITVKKVLKGLPDAPVRPEIYIDEDDTGKYPNHYSMKHSDKVRKKIAGIEPGKGPISYRKLNPDGIAGTLISGHRAPPAHYSFPRSITVREAARLQGFPDKFKVWGKFGKQMTQVTNAVPPPLGEPALKALSKFAG